jgi:hypothetical protein
MKLVIVLLAMIVAGPAFAEQPVPEPPVVEPPAAPPAAEPEALPPLPPLPAAATAAPAASEAKTRRLAGSIQLDYLALARGTTKPDKVFAGPTVELSLKFVADLGEHVTANVKACYACHGPEVGMAYFDLRYNDALNVRVGRFTPAFGSFPLRHDPANHTTSDKPLAYDMGRMVRFRDYNEGVLPAPWVDNGVEVNGTVATGRVQLDYAAYAIAGPKAGVANFDFDFVQSRSGESYYVDNNGEPVLGTRVAVSIDLARQRTLTLGGSAMAGHYDADADLRFSIVGGDATLQLGRTTLRAEYLARWTRFARGDDPDTRFKFGPGSDGTHSTFFFKDGFDLELERPFGRVSAIVRLDGLRRRGNVLAASALSDRSRILRGTIGVGVPLVASLQLKASIEQYSFNDFADETAMHLGVAGPF